MERPLMSVLMPVYNAERFLNEAIDSILNQSFTNFEFIIIDDGSTDDSAKIIKSYSDPRIRYYKNPQNMGISPSLNVGIELSKATYIARMDSDDVCHPERLQKQYDFIQANPDGALYTCWASEVDEELNFLSASYFNPDHYYHSLTFSCWIYHPTMVFRKDAVISVGKYTVPYAEDYELAWQLTREHKIYHLPEDLLNYRVNSQSLWQVTKKEEYKEAFIHQVRRNILYYLENENKISLDDYKLKILSYFTDSHHKVSVREIVASLKLQSLVTQKMIEKENPNRDPKALKAAHEEKKDFIISMYLPLLSYKEGIALLLSSGCINKLPEYLSLKARNVIARYRY